MLRAGTARLLPDSVDEGEQLLRKAYALVKPFGATKTLARCLSALASAHLFAGDLDEARCCTSAHRRLSRARRSCRTGIAVEYPALNGAGAMCSFVLGALRI